MNYSENIYCMQLKLIVEKKTLVFHVRIPQRATLSLTALSLLISRPKFITTLECNSDIYFQSSCTDCNVAGFPVDDYSFMFPSYFQSSIFLFFCFQQLKSKMGVFVSVSAKMSRKISSSGEQKPDHGKTQAYRYHSYILFPPAFQVLRLSCDSFASAFSSHL